MRRPFVFSLVLIVVSMMVLVAGGAPGVSAVDTPITRTATLHPAHVGATNPGFQTGECPAEGYGWHFVLQSNTSEFVSLSVQFEHAGTITTFTSHPTAKHAYVYTSGPDTLLGATAQVIGDDLTFNLSHVCTPSTTSTTSTSTTSTSTTSTSTTTSSVPDSSTTSSSSSVPETITIPSTSSSVPETITIPSTSSSVPETITIPSTTEIVDPPTTGPATSAAPATGPTTIGPTTSGPHALPSTGTSTSGWMSALGTLGLALGLVLLAISRRELPER